MNDQVTPAVEARRRSIAPWLILALVVILAGALVWFLTAKHVPEGDPAAFLPKDCVVAMTFDLRSSPDKQAALDVAEGIFKDAGIDDMEAWLFKQISKEADVDVGKDIVPRLSNTGGFAILPSMVGIGMEPEMVAAVGAKSEADAAYLVKFMVDHQRKKDKNIAEAVYEGVRYYKYAEGMSTTCVGAAKSVVVICNSESAFKKACDTIKGSKPNLLEQSSYMSLREVKPSTFSTLYVSGPNLYKAFIQPTMMMGGAQMPADLAKQIEDAYNSLEAVAMGDVNGDGVTSRLKVRVSQDSSSVKEVSLDELASIAPEDAAFAVSVTGVKEAVAESKERYLSSKSTKAQVDQIVQYIKMSSGIDLFTDVLDRIDGFGMYFVPRPTRDPERDMPGHFVFVLTVDKPSLFQGTLRKIKNMITMGTGTPLTETQVAGQTVTIIPAGPYGPRMGLTMVGDKVIFALTQTDIKDALTGAIRVAQNKAPTLASSGAFAMVKKQLPAQSSVLLFANAEPVVDLFRSEMDPQGQRIADAITKRIGAVGVAAEGSGNEGVIHAVMPFKK